MDASQRSLCHRNQYGSTMMETVVSLFVLAVGLLGTLAMQANGVTSHQRANLTTEANLLAADMVDRILAYNDIDTREDDDHYDGLDTSDGYPGSPDCSGGCARADQIELDEAQWGEQLASALPGGVGNISFDSTTRIYTIRVMWEPAREDAVGLGCVGDDEGTAGLMCYTYELRM